MFILKRAIQRELETKMAKGILRGDFADGDEITIDADESGIVIERTGVGTGYEQTMSMD